MRHAVGLVVVLTLGILAAIAELAARNRRVVMADSC